MRRWRRPFVALSTALVLTATGSLAQNPTPAVDDKATPIEKPDFWRTEIWSDPERGFMFYQPAPAPPKKKRVEQPKQEPVVVVGKRRLEDITNHDELKREREARLQIAIMSPTEENMRLYLEANTFMLKKSAMFADMWRRTTWANPEFDDNARTPSANFASTAIKLDRDATRKQVVMSLGRDFGVIFFARSDCPYCKLQAPVLRMLQQQYGVDVMAVSLDGRALEGFPDAKPDNGISLRVSDGRGVSLVPTMYLVSRERPGQQPQAVALGSGVLALDELLERIHVLTQLRPGQDIFGGQD